jgi:hypothetical protein
MKKPRVNFCWECGKKLRGNSYAELWIDGYTRTLHKSCTKDLLNVAGRVSSSKERLVKILEGVNNE